MELGMMLAGLINGIETVSSGVAIADALQKKFGNHSLEFQLYCALDNALRDLCEQQGWEHDPAVVASVLSSEQVKTGDLSDEEQLRSILEVFIGVSQIVSAEVQDEWIECFDRQVAQFPELYRYLDRKISVQKSKTNTSAAKTLTIIPEASYLFGREKALSDILEKLKSADIVCIHAGGGVGKTAVAAVVMDEIRKNSCEEDNGFSHFAWLTSTGSLKNDLILLNIPTSMERSTETEKLNAVIKFLQETPTFLVIDNMDSLPDRYDRSLLNTVKGKTKILITSRIPLSNLKSYRLEDLNPDPALELFYRCYLGDNEQAVEELKLRKDAEFAQKILDKAGHNALLIELIGKMASWEYRGKLEELWEKLKGNIFLASSEINIDDTEHSASHGISEKDLKLQDQIRILYALSGLSKERQEIMNFMAQFPAEMSVFREILNWAGFNINDLKWLVDRAWIERTEEGFLLHTMVKGSVWKQGIGFDIWKYGNLIDKLGKTNDYMPVTAGYVTVRKWLNTVSILSGLIADDIETKLVNAKSNQKLLIDAGSFLNNLAIVYKTQGNYGEALKYYVKTLVIREKVLGEEHPDTAMIYNNLANVYDDQGNYEEALTYHGKALAIREKVLGEEHTDTAMTYNNLANVYDDQGNYEEALKYHRKALAIREKVQGEEHLDTAMTYNNLANVWYNQGNYEKAQKYYRKALAIREKVQGEEHPDTAMTYNNLAAVSADQGNYEEALKYYGKALAIREKVLGEEHPNTATTYNNLAVVHKTQGNYEEALKYYGKALAIQEKVLGEEHPDTAMTYNNLANVYADQGNYEEAQKYYGKALAIREKVLGEEHPDTATTYNNLAVVSADQGNYEEALKYYRKALAIQEKVLGEDHPKTAMTYNNLGDLYRYQKNLGKAQKNYEKALAIQEKVLGIEHSDTATTYYNLGVLFFTMCDYKKAEAYYKKALSKLEKALGKDHPHTKQARYGLEDAERALKR